MSRNASATLSIENERHIEVAAKRGCMNLIVVDRQCRVLLDSIKPGEHELRMLLSDDRTVLRGSVASVVQPMVDDCMRTNEHQSPVALLGPQCFVRLTRLNGNDGPFFAVSVELFRGGDSLSRAKRRYSLTPREIDVLAMILEGASATEIANALQIAETTVQGYYKRLLSKTQSRNRPAMVANVLDWDGTRYMRRDSSRRPDPAPVPSPIVPTITALMLEPQR